MKKLIFLLAIAFTFSNAMAQTAWTTMYKVAPENMQAATVMSMYTPDFWKVSVISIQRRAQKSVRSALRRSVA